MLPNVSDLTNVRSGLGYQIGELPHKHDQFDFLKSGTLCGFFDDIGSLFRAIDVLNYKPKHNKSSDDSGRSFYAFDSLRHAIDVFTNKPHTIRNFKPDDRDLTAEDAIGQEVHYDVQGDYIDIGRFLEGIPEVFGRMEGGNPNSLYVTLLFNTNVVSSVSADSISFKQKQILRLVDWFESRGVRCKIRAFASTQCCHLDITVKDYSDPVDMNALAVVSHPDFLRRIVFLYDEQSKTWQSGYGSPTYFSNVMVHHYSPDPSDGLTIYIDDQSTNDENVIAKNFESCQLKVADVISSPDKRDFTRAYMVQL